MTALTDLPVYVARSADGLDVWGIDDAAVRERFAYLSGDVPVVELAEPGEALAWRAGVEDGAESARRGYEYPIDLACDCTAYSAGYLAGYDAAVLVG